MFSRKRSVFQRNSTRSGRTEATTTNVHFFKNIAVKGKDQIIARTVRVKYNQLRNTKTRAEGQGSLYPVVHIAWERI